VKVGAHTTVPNEMKGDSSMRHVKVLGPGCPRCRQLADNVEAAAAAAGLECDVQKVTSINEIMTYGVMLTPGLVIDGEVVSSGKVPNVDQIVALLRAPSPGDVRA
jgi:small redox-active disulfide protein 2